MGLSFILAPLVRASPVQAFTAGAALWATSLGTTFTLLGSSGLSSTRLGVVLTSAAMMDDIVGLIMVQVIANFGSSPSLDAVTVIRPVFVSLAFAVLLPLACQFIALPATRFLASKREHNPDSLLSKCLQHELLALAIHSCTLVSMVAGATYAGSSSLLGAYIAGAMTSWWDVAAPHPWSGEKSSVSNAHDSGDDSANICSPVAHPSNSGSAVFEKYYRPALQRVLKPFFFVCKLQHLGGPHINGP